MKNREVELKIIDTELKNKVELKIIDIELKNEYIELKNDRHRVEKYCIKLKNKDVELKIIDIELKNIALSWKIKM